MKLILRYRLLWCKNVKCSVCCLLYLWRISTTVFFFFLILASFCNIRRCFLGESEVFCWFCTCYKDHTVYWIVYSFIQYYLKRKIKLDLPRLTKNHFLCFQYKETNLPFFKQAFLHILTKNLQLASNTPISPWAILVPKV